MTQPEHPSVERISDLLAGVLPAAEAMDVNAHLASCEACRDERAALLDLTALLADVGAAPLAMPADVAASIDAAIGQASAERAAGVVPLDRASRPAGRQPWKWLAGAAAAVVVVGVGFAGLRALPQQQDTSANADHATSEQDGTAVGGMPPTLGDESAFPPSASDGGQPVFGGGGGQAYVSTAEVPAQARRLASAPEKGVSPASEGCATPITGGPSTVVVFKGHLAVLSITRDTRLATIYDCATATKTLFLTGY